jgi:hypothetical protein
MSVAENTTSGNTLSKSKSKSSVTKPAKTSAKSRRSRNGCLTCRKSKIKCDEGKPSCLNCQKSNKLCDYSIKLTWGGRPYKVPKAEKMNPVATLSRQLLNGDPLEPSILSIPGKITSSNGNATAKTTLVNGDNISVHIMPFDKPSMKKKSSGSNIREQPKIKEEYEEYEESQIIPSLCPSQNLNNLLRMSNKKVALHSLLQTTTTEPVHKMSLESDPNQFPSLDQELISFKKDTHMTLGNNMRMRPLPDIESPMTPNFSNLFNNISDNIHDVNEMLGNMMNEKLINTNPWSLLEEIEHPITGIDEEGTNGAKQNLPLTVQKFENSYNAQFEEFKLDEFAIDLNKIHNLTEMSEDNLYSIPMLNESARRTHQQTRLQESLDEFEIVPNTTESTSSSILKVLEQIPRGLLPLPDMLLNVPYYYDSFLFYINSTSSVLTPADSLVYSDNPFKIVLPKLAMTNDGLMSLIVAFGCAHKHSLLGTDASEIIDALLSRALSDLLLLLNNKETYTSDLTLTIVLLFTSFLAFNYNSDKWKIHMKGAKQIFLLRGYSKPFDKLSSDSKDEGSKISGEIKKSKLLYFLIRWFAYIDIFTNLSSPLEPTEDEINKLLDDSSGSNFYDFSSPISDIVSNSSTSPSSIFNNISSGAGIGGATTNQPQITPLDESAESQMDYEIGETEQEIMKSESHEDIDYMLGFKIKFLPIFSRLCKLIKHVNLLRKCNERLNIQSATLTPKIIESAITIQAKFQKLKYTSYDHSNSVKSKSLNAVIASNHCFLLMGLIQLYRRVMLMPRNSKIIQEMCQELMSTVCKYLNTKEPNSLCVILPLFIAGCECENVAMRPVFIEKLSDFRDRGSVSAEIAIDIVTRCWNSGEDWANIMVRDHTCVVFL